MRAMLLTRRLVEPMCVRQEGWRLQFRHEQVARLQRQPHMQQTVRVGVTAVEFVDTALQRHARKECCRVDDHAAHDGVFDAENVLGEHRAGRIAGVNEPRADLGRWYSQSDPRTTRIQSRKAHSIGGLSRHLLHQG